MYKILLNDEVIESFSTREQADQRLDEMLADDNYPSSGYMLQLPFDDEAKALVAGIQAEKIRQERDHKLTTEVDPIVTNPLRWADLTESQQQQWKDYRQALLNVPQQASFPDSVSWPEKPE